MNGVSGNSSVGVNGKQSMSYSSPDGPQYCVLWNNYHRALVSTFGMLRKEGELLDCTLACVDGGRVQAHQLILAACSNVCRDFIKDTGDKHPIILLPSEIALPELRAMVEFMYTGQVCIEQERLKAFIQGARYLRIKGLEDKGDDTDDEDAEFPGRGNDGERGKDTGREGDGEEDDNWQVVERKPIILPQSGALSPGGSRKRRRLTTSRRRPMHLSSSIVCYEREAPQNTSASNSVRHGTSTLAKHDVTAPEPINKIRRMSTQQGHFHDDLEICTCSSRKTWSVADTEALLKVWGETLTQVPPSYFIRSMSLCKRVARNLQARGVQKNWRQCQVKMKNLRREVRLFKETRCRISTRKPSEVANACEKLLPDIEEIFNKEEEIRHEWYQLKTDQQQSGGETGLGSPPYQRDILAQVAVLADSDLGDEDTDCAGLETEGEGGPFVEDHVGGGGRVVGVDGGNIVEVTTGNNTSTASYTGPSHSIHHQPDGTIHMCVEDVTLEAHPATQEYTITRK